MDSLHLEIRSACSSDHDARRAGEEAARTALASVRRFRPSCALVFASVGLDLPAVLAGVASVLGDVPTIGASAAGEICGVEHTGSVVVTVLASDCLRATVGCGERVAAGWRGALDQALSTPGIAPLFDGRGSAFVDLARAGKSAFALLFAPGSTRAADSAAFEILETMKRRSLGRVPVFGGSAASDPELRANAVFAGGRVLEDGVAVAVLETELRFGIGYAHGLRGTGRRATVTAARGHEVLELDGRPAADAYADLVGVARADLEDRHLTAATGRIVGTMDVFGEAVPNVATFLTDEGGVRLTRAVAPGETIELLRADPAAVEDAGRDAVRSASLRGGVSRPAAAIVASCALRPRVLGELVRGEIGRLALALGDAPLVGFTSFGEQAVGDDGAPLHTNAVVAALVLGAELSPAAYAVRENARLRAEVDAQRRELDVARERDRAELGRLVEERTAQLRAAVDRLTDEVEERRHAEAAARRHERALRTLGAVNEAVVRVGDEAELFRRACEIVVDRGGYRLAWIGLAQHDEARRVLPAARAGHDDGYVDRADVRWDSGPRGRGPVGTAVRTGRPTVARNVGSDEAFAVWRANALRHGFASAAALPLVAEGVTLGALAIYSGEVDAFDASELKLLGDLADDIAFGVMALRGRAQRAVMSAQLTQADRLVAMGTLAASVAHEINNPLAYLLAAVEFVSDELAGPRAPSAAELAEIKGALAEIRDGGQRIRQVVRDLKSFSRTDEAAHGPVDLHRVLESALLIAANEIRHRGRVVKELGPVPAVAANEGRLGQVFLNLLINAAQAIREGDAGRNEIRVRTATDAAGCAVVEVIDTGEGMAPETLARIFEPFFTTKPVGVGTGLGLAICRNIVKAAGGDITAASAPGGGSTFRVVLPASRSPARPAAPAAPRTAPAKRRVLAIDDEPLVLSAVRRTLAREHDVSVETSARAALERVRVGERFDAILCDLMMPEMTGMQFHAGLSAAAPEQASRVLFLTGGAFTAATQAFLAGVPNPRVEKPFDGDALRAIVAEIAARP